MLKVRQANLEVLRIICMLYIVILHLLNYGGVLDSLQFNTPQFYLYWFIEALAIVAVNCYILISGYFLIESRFRLKKLIILWGQIFFYSVGIYIVLVCGGQIAFSLKDLGGAIFPVLTVQYWFVSMYIGMYILSPFLNMAIKSLNQKRHFMCIVVLSLLFSVWATLCPFSTTLNFGDGMGIVWFVVVYFVAAYLRLYYKPDNKPGKYVAIYFGLVGLVACSKYLFVMLYQITHLEVLARGSSTFYNYNSILVYLAAIALFMAFLNVHIKKGKMASIILKVAPLTFSIYLIHDNNYVRSILWKYINAGAYSYTWYFPMLMIGIILIIYMSCSLIEWLRSRLFKQINGGSWLEKICQEINNKALGYIDQIIDGRKLGINKNELEE